jgi:hypothetical protein
MTTRFPAKRTGGEPEAKLLRVRQEEAVGEERRGKE